MRTVSPVACSASTVVPRATTAWSSDMIECGLMETGNEEKEKQAAVVF